MRRNGIVLAAMAAAVVALAGGLSFADDPPTPLKKVMVKVQANNVIITRGTLTPAAFKKAQKNIVKASEELAKLGKEAKEIKDVATRAKDVEKPEAKWDAYSDAFVKASEELAKVAGKSGVKPEEVKTALGILKKSCADCHGDFKKGEDEFK